MSPTWEASDPAPGPARAGAGWRGWARLAWRAPLLFGLLYGGLGLLLLLRLPERAFCGLHRPLTPHISQGVCRGALAILGIGLHSQGKPLRSPGAIVANHASWLDIFTLNACDRVYFVSKAEVARWPGIGWLARATGTIFITRDPRAARDQQALFEARLRAGHRLAFFPEGTSSDGRRVLPFKPTLFAAFFTPELAPFLHIQPVSLVYHAPPGEDSRFFGWWGRMDFAPHLLMLLRHPGGGRCEVTFHKPLDVRDYPNRKGLCATAEAQVRLPVTRAVEGCSDPG